MKILLIEDDRLIAEQLAKNLTEQHYIVEVAKDGQAGWDLVEFSSYDAILLDVMLPKLDGISFCRRLRSQGNLTPVILLTAQDASTNKVMGLDAGADDYIVKPFDFQELLARIRALLRRGGSSLPPLLEWNKLRLNPSTCEVSWDARSLHLTPKEYGLLEVFLRNPQRIFSCGALIEQLWSFEEPPSDDTVRSHLKGLRMKLRAAGVPEDPIETVYGIGYRLKSVDTASGVATVDGKKSTSQNANANVAAQTAAGVGKIWQQVKDTIADRVTTIAQATTLLQNDQLTEEARSLAEQEAHKLAGSLGMFGSDEGSRLAKEIEANFKADLHLAAEQKQYLTQLVQALDRELQRLNREQLPALPSANESADPYPLLLVVDLDRSLTEQLAIEATSWGIRVHSTDGYTPVELREYILSSPPDLVLLDLTNRDLHEASQGLLTQLNALTPPVPTIAIAERDNLIDRVKIARLGVRRILHEPLSPVQVLECATQLLQYARTDEARVMAVDDDRNILTALQTLLKPWGIKVYTLDNPLRFLDVLKTTAPELLILDIEMPQISGIELCKVVRNDPNWSGLSILFLTAHTDGDIRRQVFAAGADDYVSKPIVAAELVTRILNRIERSRLLRSLSETDPLTGLPNRRKSTASLLRWQQECQVTDQPLCFAIIKPNNLKQINHQFGHATGDRVLSQLAEILRRSFHSQDVIGRWGGTEFVIGMSGIAKSDAKRRLSELLKHLRQREFTTVDGTPLRVSFSCGIVQYPKDGADLLSLYQAASQQLKIKN
ncbi:response regulator [Microseira wollei]|uniref:Multi-component transcriptional regulator n=1 Tax=Microseira wollei NIES-4236 TaxID=2530354 RepID=A0AAV3XGB1_9CYAN|nr:response regulator [Microseira wollei]GET39761.1 multi-component transcriptional regulator [Microseira wollei NIES-4236]